MEIARRSESKQIMIAGLRVPGLEPQGVGRPRFPYQPLGKWHTQGSGTGDCLSWFILQDFDTLKKENSHSDQVGGISHEEGAC